MKTIKNVALGQKEERLEKNALSLQDYLDSIKIENLQNKR
jgi:hypothetical protein